MPSFTFNRGLEQAITIFFFSLSERGFVLRESIPGEIASAVACIWQSEGVGMIAITESTRIHFQGTFSLFHCTFLFVNSKYGSEARPDRSLVKTS